MKMNKDLFKVGSRFGRLVVIGSYNKNDSRHKFYKRLYDLNWSIEKAFNTPVRKGRQQ